MPYITGLGGAGSTGHFVDETGRPRLYFADENWGLPANAGRWNGGDWQADFDAFHSARAGQGFTANHCHAFGHTLTGGINDDGRTWDGVFPFVSAGDPSSGLNNTFWQRIDYMFTSAQAVDMTVFFNFSMQADIATGGAMAGKTATQWADYGTAVATRYASTPNLIWMIGDDSVQSQNAEWDALLAAVRATGDTRPISVEWQAIGATSRQDLSNSSAIAWGVTNASYNWVYYYGQTYYAVEKAWLETPAMFPVWGDGIFWGEGSGAVDDRAMRQAVWWALSSGARGCTMGSDNVFRWGSGSLNAVQTEGWFVNMAPNVRSVFEGQPDWHLLIPDTSSVLVTAGRGTHATYTASHYTASTDSYVSASRTPTGSLAVIYMPLGGSITIDQSKMGTGYGATWIDPASGAATATTAGSSYNSAPLGNNSAGGADWVLFLAIPPYATWTVP